jgi:hypothetical protein
VLRSGARALLTQAVEAEVAEFLARHADLRTETGQQCVVRHGHLPEREIMTGIGPVAIRQPRVRDREAAEGERIWYSPSIVPPYARRSKSLEVLIPVLYLKGISTGDCEEALAALVGKDAPGLSGMEQRSRWTESSRLNRAASPFKRPRRPYRPAPSEIRLVLRDQELAPIQSGARDDGGSGDVIRRTSPTFWHHPPRAAYQPGRYWTNPVAVTVNAQPMAKDA